MEERLKRIEKFTKAMRLAKMLEDGFKQQYLQRNMGTAGMNSLLEQQKFQAW